MAENKAKLVKKYERLIKKPNAKQSELDEADRKLSEEKHDSEEGLGIEEEEETGNEAYPELEEELEHEDNPDKEDE